MSTIIHTNMNLLSKYTRHGVCVLNSNQSGMTFIQDCPITRIILNNVEGAKFPTTLQVEGKGQSEAIDVYTPLVNLWGESHNNYFNNIIQKGLGVSDAFFYSNEDPYYIREEWNKFTPSGVDIRGSGNVINNLYSNRVHDSFIIRGEYNTIYNQHTDTFSGDDGFITASHFECVNATSINSIMTLPYELKHRDVKQIAKPNETLTNIQIRGQTYRDGNHPLSVSPNGIIIHTDGILNHSSITGIDAISDTLVHGISSVCLKNSFIDASLLQTKTNSATPTISLRDRKGYGISENNIIKTYRNTIVDVDDTINQVGYYD